MKFKPYNVKVRHTGRGVEHSARLHRDLTLEMHKTVELLKAIGQTVARLQSSGMSYQVLREHEVINERLADIVEQWSDDEPATQVLNTSS